jgi:hypothetical protein
VVNALVEATPISGPARVRKRSLLWRISADSGTLQMVSVSCSPCALACCRAASVSAVSPDCEMVMTRVSGSDTDSRYRYSLAISTLTGTAAIDSSQYLATTPEW